MAGGRATLCRGHARGQGAGPQLTLLPIISHGAVSSIFTTSERAFVQLNQFPELIKNILSIIFRFCCDANVFACEHLWMRVWFVCVCVSVCVCVCVLSLIHI